MPVLIFQKILYRKNVKDRNKFGGYCIYMYTVYIVYEYYSKNKPINLICYNFKIRKNN